MQKAWEKFLGVLVTKAEIEELLLRPKRICDYLQKMGWKDLNCMQYPRVWTSGGTC
jgi:hypothetical protein